LIAVVLEELLQAVITFNKMIKAENRSVLI